MLVIVQSMTDAIRLKKALLTKNIRVEVKQIAEKKSGSGCTYAVWVPETALAQAEQMSRALGLRIVSLRRDDDG